MSGKRQAIILTVLILLAFSLQPPHCPLARAAASEKKAIPEAVSIASESVVSIHVAKTHRYRSGHPDFLTRFLIGLFESKVHTDRLWHYRGEGSGVVVESSGLVLTNAHVVEGARQIKVKFSDKQEYIGKVLGSLKTEDLALIRITPSQMLKPIRFADSDQVKVGESVVAIGNPYGWRFSVAGGIVSAKDRHLELGGAHALEGLIQVDAALNPGNSGGPIVNAKGEMIGIATIVRRHAQGLGFAIPSNRVRALLPELEHGWKRSAGLEIFFERFGLALGEKQVGNENQIVIEMVAEESKAEEAMLGEGDRLVRFASTRLRSVEDLVEAAKRVDIGQRVRVEIWRGERRYFTYLEAVK